MSRNGGVRDALSRLKLRHNSIVDRRKKDRKSMSDASFANRASTLAGPSSPAKKVGKNSLAELDSHLPSPSQQQQPSSNASVAASTKMPSVAEWLLWGDGDREVEQQQQQQEEEVSTPSPSPARSSKSPSKRSPRRSVANPQAATATDLSTPQPISESHSFDNSQFSSHYYSEFTDDYTVDSIADVTLASSQEPGLWTHGLMAVGELFAPSSVAPTPPATPSPERRRTTGTVRSRSDYHHRGNRRSLMHQQQQADTDDDSTTCSKEKDSPSVTTATTASTSPSTSDSWGRGYQNLTNVNIIDSSGMEEVEMSLETVTRIEI